ncbi:MAG: helix-turn-helix domain-containing protein [Synergistaceae bacterium]|nr:helix-turn-helix domain-containing protein [Synergistaceae bacterium]
METDTKTIMTIRQAAREYGFPEYAIRTLTKRGAFPVIQVGKRCYIVRQVFEDYLQKGGERYNAKL